MGNHRYPQTSIGPHKLHYKDHCPCKRGLFWSSTKFVLGRVHSLVPSLNGVEQARRPCRYLYTRARMYVYVRYILHIHIVAYTYIDIYDGSLGSLRCKVILLSCVAGSLKWQARTQHAPPD